VDSGTSRNWSQDPAFGQRRAKMANKTGDANAGLCSQPMLSAILFEPTHGGGMGFLIRMAHFRGCARR
jgi:hypothetical protein